MPPKAKFTKEEVIGAALEIARRDGFEALTARSLGSELGCSARPIFTVFDGMDEVQSEVIGAARRLYERYEDESMTGAQAFKGSGVGYIRFAAEQPRLFRLLFMTEKESVPTTVDVLKKIDNYYERIVESVMAEYGFGRKVAEKVYLQLWLYSHGIATAIATGICAFTAEQISEMLGEAGAAVIRYYRSLGAK